MTVTEQPDDNAPLKTQRVSLPSRDQISAVQVNTLLSAVQGLSSIMRLTEEDGGVRDGGTLAAVETTIIKACGQLDNIFDDAARWNLRHQNLLEAQLSEVYKMHISVMEGQKVAVAATMAPHRTAAPKLLRLRVDCWAAILGDPEDWDNCIVGIGPNPAAALANFDEVFNGLVKQSKQETNEQTTEVDTGGDSGSSEPPSGGADVRGSSEATESDGGELPPQV